MARALAGMGDGSKRGALQQDFVYNRADCGDEWGLPMNNLYFGDNLAVLKRYIENDSVDLVYLDPPFNSKETYNVLYRSPLGGDAQVRAFEDTWRWEDGASTALAELSERDLTTFKVLESLQRFLGTSDMMAYLAMMAVRLVELKRVLKPTGSLYLHCDPTACHYLKVLLDAVFGGAGFVNQITWKRSHAHSDGAQGSKHYGRVSDILLFYAQSPDRVWNVQYTPYSQQYIDRDYRRLDEHGRRYRLDNIQGPGRAAKGNPFYEVMGVERHWRYSRERMARLIAEGRILQTRPGAVPQLKRYLDEMPGVPVQEIWTDIPIISNRSKETLRYPTQKPLALLERIIRTSSDEGDVVLDPFCGCGTAIHASEKLKRRWIGIDIAIPAIQVIEDRLRKWLPEAQYSVKGIPSDELSARRLAKNDWFSFQQWAVGRCRGRSGRMGGDGGIDGEIIFQTGRDEYGRAIVSVKAGRHVGPDKIRELAGVMTRESADAGVFVCLNEPSREMKATAHSYGRVKLPGGDRPKIQIVEISELLRGPDLAMPTALDTIAAAQAAKKESRRQLVRQPDMLPDVTPFEKVLSRRLAVAALIVSKLHDDKNLGRTKFAKIFYLADKRAELELKTDYARQAAGPLDQRALYHGRLGIEALARKHGLFEPWLKGKMIRYQPLPKLDAAQTVAQRYLGDKLNEVARVIEVCSTLTTDQAEIIATLYACWNDLMIRGKPPTDDDIVRDFLENWHPNKERFPAKRLLKGINWMRSQNLAPTGRGGLTSARRVDEVPPDIHA